MINHLRHPTNLPFLDIQLSCIVFIAIIFGVLASSPEVTRAFSPSAPQTFQPSLWFVFNILMQQNAWDNFHFVETSLYCLILIQGWATRQSCGVPELHEDQWLRLVGHTSWGGGGSSQSQFHTVLEILSSWFWFRSGSLETGQATTLGRMVGGIMPGISERSTLTWWAIV